MIRGAVKEALCITIFWLVAVIVFAFTCERAMGASGECEIILTGDLQNATMCDNAAGATTAWEAAFDWIIARDPALVYLPGDLVEGNQFHHDYGNDCHCMSLPLTGTDCTNSTNPEGYACSVCNVPRAVACDLGTPGWGCEFSRAKRWRDRVEAAGIPIVVGPGNHCADWAEPDGAFPGFTKKCVQEFHTFNSYFGEGLTTDNALTPVTTWTPVVECADAADGLSTQPTHKAFKFDCGGTPMKFVEVSYTSNGNDFNALATPPDVTSQMKQPVIDWALSQIRADPKMPTILGTHLGMVDYDCTGTLEDDYDHAWCTGTSYFGAVWYGYGFFDHLDKEPNVFMNLFGHIRHNMHKLTTKPSGKPLIGIAHDHSYQWQDDYAGRPAWAIEANGGAGSIMIIKIDANSGVISTRAFSPYYEERYGFFDTVDDDWDVGTDWSVQLPMCADRGRFEFADGFCQEEPPADCNCTERRGK